MRSKPEIDLILVQMKRDILALVPEVLEFILFGSAARDERPRDIDVVLVVANDTDLFEISRTISPIVASHVAKSATLISCFPIKAQRYRTLSSQFLSNVHAYGRKF